MRLRSVSCALSRFPDETNVARFGGWRDLDVQAGLNLPAIAVRSPKFSPPCGFAAADGYQLETASFNSEQATLHGSQTLGPWTCDGRPLAMRAPSTWLAPSDLPITIIRFRAIRSASIPKPKAHPFFQLRHRQRMLQLRSLTKHQRWVPPQRTRIERASELMNARRWWQRAPAAGGSVLFPRSLFSSHLHEELKVARESPKRHHQPTRTDEEGIEREAKAENGTHAIE